MSDINNSSHDNKAAFSNMPNANPSALLERAFLMLEDGDFNRADYFFEQVLNSDPKNAEAYLGKLLLELGIRKKEELFYSTIPFDTNGNFEKILRFGNENIVSFVNKASDAVKTRIQNENLEAAYINAIQMMERAQNADDFTEAANAFSGIEFFKDCASKKSICLEEAKRIRFDDLYFSACKVFDPSRSWSQKDYTDSLNTFNSIIGWRDSEERVKNIEQKIVELSALEAKNAELKKKKIKRAKKIICISSISICIIAVAVFVLIKIVMPLTKYNNAVSLMNKGEYDKAITAFEELDDFKDSKNNIKRCKYEQALSYMQNGEFDKAIRGFEKLSGYSDSREKINECKYNKAESLLGTDEKKALEIFSSLGDFNDSLGRIMSIANNYYNNGDKYKAATTYAIAAKNSKDAWQKSMDIWGEITERETVAAGWNYTVAVKNDGTVVSTDLDFYSSDYDYNQNDVSDWTDIIAVSAGWEHTVGLKKDGTVVAVGNNESDQCNVSEWRDIVAIFAGSSATHGLKMDGSVVSTGYVYGENDAMKISGWYGGATSLTSDGKVTNTDLTDIVDFYDADICVAVKKDGTVVLDVPSYYEDTLPNVSSWRNIIDIKQSMYLIVGLKSDGTVVCTSKSSSSSAESEISSWRNIVSISVDCERIVALTSSGRVLSTGYGVDAAVDGWYDIKVN